MSRCGPTTLWEFILFFGLIAWHYIKPVVIVALIVGAVIGWVKLLG